MTLDPNQIILHPYVTEKTMAHMEEDNKLEFVVHMGANKRQIRWAIQNLFEVAVSHVNTRVHTDGSKHAIVSFPAGVDAEDVGMRIGIF